MYVMIKISRAYLLHRVLEIKEEDDTYRLSPSPSLQKAKLYFLYFYFLLFSLISKNLIREPLYLEYWAQ